MEIRMSAKNPAIEKVAIKSGYQKEGMLKESYKSPIGHFRDSYVYAKTKSNK